MIKEFIQFLDQFLLFIGTIILCIVFFIILQTLLDMNNPCSNFSDIQDECSERVNE